MRDYVLPRLTRKRVDAVTTADVMAVLLPICSTKRVTARRVRQRIGAVMKWAVAQGYRDDNPAGDAISMALPKTAVRKQHTRALPHAEVGAALARVKGSCAYPGTMLAFEFLVLTAARSGEVRNARWEQIDRDGAVWTIPAERMKAAREHRVPLAPRALAALDGAAELFDGHGLVFPSPTGRALNHATLTNLLHGLGIDAVAHGFRSSFRDWAAECTDAPCEVCELALAHVNCDRVEAAYRRTDLSDRRRVLMNDWARTSPDALRHHRLRAAGSRGRDARSTAPRGGRGVAELWWAIRRLAVRDGRSRSKCCESALDAFTLAVPCGGCGVSVPDSGREHGFGAPCLPALRFVRTAREGASPASLATPRATARRHEHRGVPRSPRGHKNPRGSRLAV